MTMSGPAAPSDLLEEYLRIRATTERLASVLSAEDQTVQTMPDVSPTKWHRAHVTWFFETFVLGEYASGYHAFDDAYAYIFNSYYEAMGARHPRPERGLLVTSGHRRDRPLSRPTSTVRWTPCCRDTGQPGLVELITLGLHHEQQHQELLLMDIKHVLSRNPLHPAYLPAMLPRARRPPAQGRLARARRRPRGDRPPRRGVRIRQRVPGPHGAPHSVRAGRPSCDLRRMALVHGGRRVPTSGVLALRRLGRRQRPGLGRAPLLVP